MPDRFGRPELSHEPCSAMVQEVFANRAGAGKFCVDDPREDEMGLQKGKQLWRMVWAGSVCLVVLGLFSGVAMALTVNAPQEVPLGKPFRIQITAEAGLSEIGVHWLGSALRLPMGGGEKGKSFECLLGSDVKSASAGEYALEVRARRGEQEVVERRWVRLAEAAYPLQRLSLPSSQVDLSQSALDRHYREKARVLRVLSRSSPAKHWRLPLKRPVPQAVGSVYGLRREINGQPRSPHRGVDFRAPAGTPVRSVAAGRVALVGDHFFAGKSVYVDHGWGMVSMYFHLRGARVQEGERVGRGAVLGRCGATGRVTGAHLHFGLSLLGQLVDPLPLLNVSSGQ